MHLHEGWKMAAGLVRGNSPLGCTIPFDLRIRRILLPTLDVRFILRKAAGKEIRTYQSLL